MREKGERVCVLSEGRKGGDRLLIQTESVYNQSAMFWFLIQQDLLKPKTAEFNKNDSSESD